MTLEALRERTDALRTEIGRTVLGQDDIIDLLLIALFARGHVLLEGPPGTAKTLLARSFCETTMGETAGLKSDILLSAEAIQAFDAEALAS